MGGVHSPPQPTPRVQREFVRGPRHGQSIALSPAIRQVHVGWMTAWYELGADGRMHWRSLADRPKEDAQK